VRREQRRHAVDVHRLATVRGRDQRDVSELRPRRSAPPLAISGRAWNGFRRRAPEGDLVQRIADREAELAVR